jgi:hypothetical protein
MLPLLLACGGADGPRAPGHPLDDVLTFADLQAKGTHNSYHTITNGIPALQYEHAPLGVQLEDQGVRQFELDVAWDLASEGHLVYHLPLIDQGTTCERFTDCARALFDWSSARPGHHPLFVLIETKDGWEDDTGPSRLDALEDELLSVWPRERLVTPADLRRGHADLRTALADEGWPTLGELRGRALFVLHDGGARRDAFVAQDLDEAVLFPDAMGDAEQPWSAVHTMNDPNDPRIPEVVGRHHLVRTRADGDLVEVYAEDVTNRDAALASGAHFVSTDVPVPDPRWDYVVEIPGGTPSRCNPLHAPPECTSEDVEDLR